MSRAPPHPGHAARAASSGPNGSARHSGLREVHSPAESTISTIPKVVLLLETSREYGRRLLPGIVRYARLHGRGRSLCRRGSSNSNRRWVFCDQTHDLRLPSARRHTATSLPTDARISYGNDLRERAAPVRGGHVTTNMNHPATREVRNPLTGRYVAQDDVRRIGAQTQKALQTVRNWPIAGPEIRQRMCRYVQPILRRQARLEVTTGRGLFAASGPHANGKVVAHS